MTAVTIVVNGAEAHIYSGYNADLVGIIKSIPGRRFSDGKPKFWAIPSPLVDGLVRQLRAAGFPVTVEGQQETRPRQQATPVGGWADELLGDLYKLNPLLAEKAFTALVRILHPDLGNDTTRLMQQLNDARASLQRRAA